MSANLIQMWLAQFDRGELSNEEVEGGQVWCMNDNAKLLNLKEDISSVAQMMD
ncbi:hypothetical protein VAPA_2c00720 [Variovorax paradoxus B4]|uniref:Uncharacterized protein n=1 Tax=Variovorax paradoxus B4 TaxID=1246301 RepID=T1XJC2_VARPD|nr:hypothetical protein [Variovorax paradoxus]AGU52636.1 hypothetical protein VAPA_2c00720 [Variovorax paradoxus B4]